MDDQLYNQFLRRIRVANDPAVAKDIDTDILMSRHDYFGREICRALEIEYRNDVPIIDIFLEIQPGFDPMRYTIPNITPDNYLYRNGILYVIDYKVSVSTESSLQTNRRYRDILDGICPLIGLNYEVVIIRANPMNNEIYFSSDSFRDLFGPLVINLDFSRFLDIKRLLFEKFGDNEEFLLKVSHGDFTITAPWCKERTPELYDNNVFLEFMNSMSEEYQEMFLDSIMFNPHEADKWNVHLINLKERTSKEYEQYITDMAVKLFESTGNYKKPTRIEIEKGWEEMSNRVQNEREISKDIMDQKPSGHFIWSPPDDTHPKDNIGKILFISKLLQDMSGSSEFLEAFRMIGKAMDFSANVPLYNRVTLTRKEEARSQKGKVMNKKLEPVQIGEALVFWEQQFSLVNDKFDKLVRSSLLKNFFGIGSHKQFKSKMIDDIEVEKPKILDFNSDDIYLESIKMLQSTKNILGRNNNLDENKDFIYSNFSKKIRACSERMEVCLQKIINCNFWNCLNDISVLMKNMLSLSQYNRHNSFRIATCANNSIFGLVLPSSDIKTKRATLVFCIIAVHREKESLLTPGALHATFKSGQLYVSISRAMRLDKERCQRLVTSPGLFLTTSMLFYYYSPNSDLLDIMTFAFYSSISITKSLLSLTEPSRYMIMNSLALSSHVREYIAEKFSPYTKTLFSVYVTRLIKIACFNANSQREKISLRSVALSEYDITQKGVEDNEDFDSIWFPGKVTLKAYINQIYLPFYFNPKGLHEKHHVLIDLAKTVLEIERDQRLNCPEPWSGEALKQTVNLPILIHSLAKNLLVDTSRHNHLRNKIENRNNFNRSITTISTFTSSKSCIKLGNYSDLKEKQAKDREKGTLSVLKRMRIANPLFVNEEDLKNEVAHSNYNNLRQSIPLYKDFISTKVFDRLYELLKTENLSEDGTTIQNIMKMMREHTDFYFTFFNKGQKTAKDREIFVGEFEAKMCMYAVERLAKERCKLNPDEMISEPGDGKLKVLEMKSEQEIRFIIETIKQRNQNLIDDILLGNQRQKFKATKIEINADMSKWSAQDVFFKYFWLIAMDPILYPNEKERMLYFMCNYMNKKLILPDELLCSILDQKMMYRDDIIMEMTDNLNKNHVEIKRNWLQGNFNYTSSYVHSCAMSVYKDILRTVSIKTGSEVLVNSLVHSDDNHTSIVYIHDKLHQDLFVEHSIMSFEKVCLAFGCQANMKKTYLNNTIKEFVSLFCISGEPFSIFGRFLLTSVGDCAYIGPYEDMASRLTSTQTAIKHGCPPSLAWLSIAINHWITFTTYNMLPGQVNDPTARLPLKNRSELPVELFGILNADLSTIALTGLESGNLTFLVELLIKNSPIEMRKETIIDQSLLIKTWDLNKFSDTELFKMKILRYLVLDAEIETDSVMGETSEMRGRSIITPRKFTTIGTLKKLISYLDYQKILSDEQKANEVFEYMAAKPELLVTKGETKEDYIHTILFRYNSKKFKESLSIQNPAQLFIEQILFSHKPVIDYSGIRDKFSMIGDNLELEEQPDIIGRMTFNQVYENLSKDMAALPLTLEDVQVVYDYMILNDPLLTTIANALILKLESLPQSRTGVTACNMPEMRNLKLITHSPALVLRAYSQKNPDIAGADIEEMKRDLLHLEEFVEKTRLKEKMEDRIAKNQIANRNERDIKYELKELTKFYQICYEYVKSTDHKIKVFILPSKAYTSIDFCALVQGNLIKDEKWIMIHYLKSINTIGYKGIIQRTSSGEMNLAMEAIRLIAYFGDTFINPYSRKRFLKEIIDNFTYKFVPVEYLYRLILNSHVRHEFLPVLYWTGEITQHDLDKYDAMKANEHVSWNDWQVNRNLGTGPINLKITAYNKSLYILGEDDILKVSELQLTKISNDYIHIAGKRLLSSKHNLRFELFKRYNINSDFNYYITYQRKAKNIFVYQILNSQTIERRNSEHAAVKTRVYNEIVPVCPVIIAEMPRSQGIELRTIKNINYDNNNLTRLKISDREYSIMKRAHLYKMQNFDGPKIKTGILNINKLMKTPELLNTNYSKVSRSSIVSLSKILECDGTTDDDVLEFLCDDPMDDEEVETIESEPIFTVTYLKKGKKVNSYKSAIKTLIFNETENFESIFDFSKVGFLSGKNLGILEVIISLVKILKTNEWSTIMLNCIHICLIRHGYDRQYHLFELPKMFVIDPISHKLNWGELKRFVINLPEIAVSPWDIIFTNFKIKCSELIDRELGKENRFGYYLDSLEKDFGRSMFDFE
uniref:RNA-directed RNA polymerase L n=1 Tax=Wolkberg virus TaxID=1867943 RepID=A0A1Y9T5B7_9VIRU|nr:RNA-dependent RNA polymerase [Wolkberg virus]